MVGRPLVYGEQTIALSEVENDRFRLAFFGLGLGCGKWLCFLPAPDELRGGHPDRSHDPDVGDMAITAIELVVLGYLQVARQTPSPTRLVKVSIDR